MATVPDRNLLYRTEIEACRDDFTYFCENYLKILDRNSQLVNLKLKPAQAKLLLAIDKNPWQVVLKARQLGSSTLIAAYFFWKSLFTPNERTLVVAHTHDAVKNIYRIYTTFYENLPKFLQFSTKTSSANEIVFFHGGTIRVSSATGQNFRGSTYNNLHCSEVAFWKDMAVTIAGLFQTATGNSCIILETTANGLNQFHNFWNDEGNGYDKTFLSWTDEPEYISNNELRIPENILEYAAINNLSAEQTRWAAETLAVKCANSFPIFLQEYAVDPITCFIASGTRYFAEAFPNAVFSKGYKKYAEPSPYSSYILGADTASGSPNGDYSAFVVIDVVNPEKPAIVATYCDHITPMQFAERVYKELKKWNALAVIENNSYGLVIIEMLRNEGYGKLFTKQTYDQVNKVWTEKLGWHTNTTSRRLLLSNLQGMVDSKQIDIIDSRIQYQINTFVYDADGKPDHQRGSHDDLLFSLGLAIMGIDQAIIESHIEKHPMPRSVEDIINLELKAGCSISTLREEGYFTDVEDRPTPSISALQWTIEDKR